MKIFHLSDLHIGLKLINRDLREDQEYILNQIIQKAKEEKPDAILIAGDIYDKAVPSAEAVEVFDHFIGNLRTAVPEYKSEKRPCCRYFSYSERSSAIFRFRSVRL